MKIFAFVVLFCISARVTPVFGQSIDNGDSLAANNFIEQAKKSLHTRDFEEVRRNYNKVLHIYSNNKVWNKYYSLKIDYGYSWILQNKPDSALFYFNAIEDEIEARGFFDYYILYRVYQEQAVANALQNHNRACIEAFQKNVTLTKLHDPKTKGEAMLARAYMNIATTYRDLKNLNIALAYYDSALADLKKEIKGPSEIEQVIYQNKGNLLADFGYFEEGLENLRYSQHLLKTLDSEIIDPVDQGFFNLYMGFFYSKRNYSLKDNQRAIQYADSAYNDFIKVDPEIIYLPYINYLYAENFQHLGRYDKSLKYIRKAIQQNIKFHGPEYGELGYCYQTLGSIYEDFNKKDSAAFYYKKSVELYKQIDWENTEETAEAFITLAEFNMKQSAYQEALRVIQESLQVLMPRFKKDNYLENPSNDLLYNSEIVYLALKTKAEILSTSIETKKDPAKLAAIVDCYDKLIYHINLTRQGLTSLNSKKQFFNKKYNVYEKGILAAISAYKNSGDKVYLEKAFNYSEQSKSRSLTDKLVGDRKFNFNIPTELVTLETDLKSQISLLEKKNYTDETDSMSIRKEIFSLKYKLDSLIAEIRISYPNYHSTKYNADVNIALLKQYLNEKNAALVEFFTGKDSIYAFNISKDLSYSVIDKKILQETKAYITSLKTGNSDKKIAFSLYENLLKDVPIDKSRQLIIITDNILSNLPFETLLTSKASSTEIKSWDFLIKKTVVSYHYSTKLLLQQKTKPSTSESLVAFAPTFADNKNTLLATRSVSDSISVSKLVSLPHAENEAISIAQDYSGKARIGDDASENAFRKDSKYANILHIASHTLLDNQNPLYSKIVLKKDDIYDGLIYTYELYNMNINADMVTLSACNTGTGKYYDGEGVMSLARGFMYAGVPNVTMSLWSVPDKSTATIMESFYKYLKKDYGKAEALRQAKLDYLAAADNNTAAPYYWAGFVFIGDPSTNKNNNLWIIIVVAAGLVSALVFYRTRRNRSKRIE